MRLYWCDVCRAKFSTEADDIQIHYVQHHGWSPYQAMVWFEQQLMKGFKR